jgi:DNA-binding beta-propeller fold protein YncE
MRRLCLVIVVGIAIVAFLGLAQQAPSTGPYKVLQTAKVGGEGGFDYVYADSDGRTLYIPRKGPEPRVTVFDLDTLKPAGVIEKTSANGAAVDPKSGHGFASSKPVAMWDTKTMQLVKTIDVTGGPDGILFDSFNQRVWVFSHGAPNATVIDSRDGSVIGTVDLGGAPEQAVTDGMGHMYVDIEDKDNIAAVDTKTMTVTAHYDLGGKGSTPAGLGFDVKNHILFVACRQPAPGVMVIMNSQDGKIISTVPLAGGSDGAVFNPKTMEAFSSAANATLTVIKENSPTSFEQEQVLTTMQGGKTLTLDSKTGHILIIAAEYGPPPAPPADAPKDAPKGRGGRGGRAPMLPDSFSIVMVGK